MVQQTKCFSCKWHKPRLDSRWCIQQSSAVQPEHALSSPAAVDVCILHVAATMYRPGYVNCIPHQPAPSQSTHQGTSELTHCTCTTLLLVLHKLNKAIAISCMCGRLHIVYTCEDLYTHAAEVVSGIRHPCNTCYNIAYMFLPVCIYYRNICISL